MEKYRIGNRIKNRRKELKLTLSDVASSVGVAISTIQRYEAGTIDKMKLPVIEAIARALQVNPAWLIGKTDAIEHKLAFSQPHITDDVVGFPIHSKVAEGCDKMELETLDGNLLDIPRAYLNGRDPSDYFVLCVNGNSMYPMYQNGDRVLILRQSSVNRSGDVGVVVYDGGQATLKRIDFANGEQWMRLVPINPDYPSMTIEGSDLDLCRILGIPRLLLREF